MEEKQSQLMHMKYTVPFQNEGERIEEIRQKILNFIFCDDLAKVEKDTFLKQPLIESFINKYGLKG